MDDLLQINLIMMRENIFINVRAYIVYLVNFDNFDNLKPSFFQRASCDMAGKCTFWHVILKSTAVKIGDKKNYL